MKTDGCGNDGLMDSEENQTQVSRTAHSPWKSLLRFPHSHSRDEPVEKWKSQNRAFPLSHCSVCPLLNPKNQTKKGGLAAVATLPPPGSFFNEKMLWAVGPNWRFTVGLFRCICPRRRSRDEHGGYRRRGARGNI